MTDKPDTQLHQALDRFSGTAAPRGQPRHSADTDDFPGEFAALKLRIIRPTFEKIGALLTERGHDVSVSEEPNGKISIHIVPAGVSRSIHAYDWFPTLTFFGVPYSKTVGLQGCNARRNSEGSSGSRGDYKPAQVSAELVEKELMRFIGEIANW